MNMKKILLSVAMVGCVATQAMASLDDVKAQQAFGRASAAQQERLAERFVTSTSGAALRGRIIEAEREALPQAMATAPMERMAEAAIGRLDPSARIRVVRQYIPIDIYQQLAQNLAAQLHDADPTYNPPENFDDPRALEELLEKVRGMRIRAPHPAATCDGDFEVVSRSDLTH